MQTQVISVPYLFAPSCQQIMLDMREHGMTSAFTATDEAGGTTLFRSGQSIPAGGKLVKRYRISLEKTAHSLPSLF